MSSASHTHKVDTWFNNSLSNTTSWLEKIRSSSNQQQQQSSTKNKKKNTLSFATNKKNSKQQQQSEEEQKLNYIPVKRIDFKFSSSSANDDSIAVDEDASSALARQALKCSDYYYSKDSSSLHHQNVTSLEKVCLVKTPSTEKEKGEVCIVNNNETDTEENGQKKGRTNQSSSFFISSALPRVVQTTTSIINQNNNDNNNSNNSIPVAKNPLFVSLLHGNRKRETDGTHHHHSTTSTLQLLSSIQTALEWISGGNEFYEDFKKGFARDVLVKEAHYVLCRMKIKSRSRNKNKDTQNTFWTPVEHLIPELIAELKSKYGLTFLDLAGSDVSTMVKDDDVDNDDDYSRTQRDAFSNFLIEAIRDHQHRYSIGSNPSTIKTSASTTEHPLLTVAKKNDGTWSLRPVFYVPAVMTKNGMTTTTSNSNTSSSMMLVHPPSPALLAARLLHLLDGDTGVVRAVGVLQRAALLESRSECVMTGKGKRMLASSFEYMFRLVAIAMVDIQSITTTNNHHYYHDPDVIFNQIMKVIETDARDSIAAKDFGILNPFAVVEASSPSSSATVKERLSSAVKKPTPKKKSAVKRVKIEDSSASSDADDHDSDDEDGKQDSAIKKQKTPFSAIKSLAILGSDDKNKSKNPIVNPIISSSSNSNNSDERKIKDQSEIEATIKRNFPLFADSKLPSPCLTCGLFACPSSSGVGALCPLPGLKLWILPSGLVDPEEAERRARQLQLQKEREEKEAREAEQKAIAEAEKRKRKEEREAAARKAREEELERKIKEERDRKLRRERECSPHETLLLLHELMKTLRSQRAPAWWWYDSVMLILETLGFNGDGLAVFYQLPRTTNDIVEAIHFTLERSQRMENDAEFREQMEQLSQKQMASVLRTDSAVVSFFSDEQMVNILMQKEVAQVLDRVLGEVWVDRDRQIKGMNLVPIKDTVYV